VNMNIVIVGGNLTRDPELRHLPTGNTAVCGFSIACNEKWKDSSGQAKESVSYFDCEAWGKTAETIAQYFVKGKPIVVQGRLKQETWKDKTDGSNRSKIKVSVTAFHFCGGKSDDEAAPAASKTTRRAPAPDPIQEEDIPF